MIETNLGASKPIDPNRIVKIGYGYLWLPMPEREELLMIIKFHVILIL